MRHPTASSLALAAWDTVGPHRGDRVEHAAVAGPDEAARLAAHRITVVTQPAFIAARGDAYLHDVDAYDHHTCGRAAR